MIKSDLFSLRTIRETDLAALHLLRSNIDSRGDYYPRQIPSEVASRKRFESDGYWGSDSGSLLILNQADRIIGEIEFFKPVPYWNAYEIAYILFDQDERGKGIVTEATRLLVRYLFETRTVNRIQLCIHPDNVPSRRVAEKLGFTHEGTARGAWFQRGKHQDMEVYSILRDEVIS
jgi:RimJ/RimL family protein N-acetyltransferase